MKGVTHMKKKSPAGPTFFLMALLTIVVLGLLYVGITQSANRGSAVTALVIVMPFWALAAHRLTR